MDAHPIDVDPADGAVDGVATASDVEGLLATLVPSASSTSGKVIDWWSLLPPELADLDVIFESRLFGLSCYVTEPPSSWPQDVFARLGPHLGALGELLEHLPPGELLGRLLVHVDVKKVDDFSLVEVVAAHKRMEAWAAARAAEAAAELSSRPALSQTWPRAAGDKGRWACFGADELAVRLGIGPLTARRLVMTGRALRRTFYLTAEALDLGRIDFPKAQAIVSALDGLDVDVGLAAELEVIEGASGRTLHQLREDITEAIVAVDPDGSDERHRAARQQRRVNRPRPLPDGMALTSAVLPAADAIALDLSLDAAARAAKNNGDRRTLDQLRADALALLGHTAVATGHIGPHPDTHCHCGCTTAPPERGPATSGAAAELPALPAPVASEPCPLPADGPPLPGVRLSAGGLPHIRLGMIGGGRVDVRVTVPLSVLLPDPDAPDPADPDNHALSRDPVPVARLEGYGPIAPEAARALAAGGVWRRLVTDPTGTEVLDVGRTRYQPTAAIADHVRHRDGSCVRPGCSAPARACDLDHRHEWQDGGATSVTNLQALCRRDHALKSIGAYTVARASNGSYAWTTATGHGYLRHPDGHTSQLPHRVAVELRRLTKAQAEAGREVDATEVDQLLDRTSSSTGAPAPPEATSWAERLGISDAQTLPPVLDARTAPSPGRPDNPDRERARVGGESGG